MRILVIKSSLPTYWYANRIGEVFPDAIIDIDDPNDYIVRDKLDGTKSYILIDDCLLISDT